jgi:hypothetical protein
MSELQKVLETITILNKEELDEVINAACIQKNLHSLETIKEGIENAFPDSSIVLSVGCDYVDLVVNDIGTAAYDDIPIDLLPFVITYVPREHSLIIMPKDRSPQFFRVTYYFDEPLLLLDNPSILLYVSVETLAEILEIYGSVLNTEFEKIETTWRREDEGIIVRLIADLPPEKAQVRSYKSLSIHKSVFEATVGDTVFTIFNYRGMPCAFAQVQPVPTKYDVSDLWYTIKELHDSGYIMEEPDIAEIIKDLRNNVYEPVYWIGEYLEKDGVTRVLKDFAPKKKEVVHGGPIVLNTK